MGKTLFGPNIHFPGAKNPCFRKAFLPLISGSFREIRITHAPGICRWAQRSAKVSASLELIR